MSANWTLPSKISPKNMPVDSNVLFKYWKTGITEQFLCSMFAWHRLHIIEKTRFVGPCEFQKEPKLSVKNFFFVVFVSKQKTCLS